MRGPLLVDVAAEPPEELGDAHVLVLVEPLHGCVAVAAALDAGWGSVELAPELEGQAPLPLVSFEQAPPVEHRGGRCRVRCGDLTDHACRALASDHLAGAARSAVWLGAPALARPLAATLARFRADRVTFLPVPSTHAALGSGVGVDAFQRLAADAWWASGLLVRVLLDELDGRDAELTDAAGIAVSLATGAEEPTGQLGTGVRWRRHLARGGAADDLRVAGSLDSLAVVPRVDLLDGVPVATPAGPVQVT